MNKEMIMSLAGSVMRKALVFAIAKWGVGSWIGDAEIASIVNGVTVFGIFVWGCVEKRKAHLATPPVAK